MSTPLYKEPHSRHDTAVVSLALKLSSCLGLLFFSVTATLFAEASKLQNGEYPYNTFMIPLSVEACKFAVSSVLLLSNCVRSHYSSHSSRVYIQFKVTKFVLYGVPAFCYFISNNCMFYIIRDLGASTFQVTSNLKILTTGVLMRIFLSRRLSWLQWKALMILAIGSVVTQLKLEDGQQMTSVSGSGRGSAYAVVCSNALAAGAGGVFSEKLLKSKDENVNKTEPIHWQNMQLYIFGVAFGVLSLYTSHIDVSSKGIFAGFNTFAFATVATLTICGLLVSFILKYIDNVAKCFVAALSMICVAFIDTAVKREAVSLQLFLGILLTCIALEQYNLSER